MEGHEMMDEFERGAMAFAEFLAMRHYEASEIYRRAMPRGRFSPEAGVEMCRSAEVRALVGPWLAEKRRQAQAPKAVNRIWPDRYVSSVEVEVAAWALVSASGRLDPLRISGKNSETVSLATAREYARAVMRTINLSPDRG